MQIKKLYFYPFKSCNHQETQRLSVIQDLGIEGDRNFAFVRNLNKEQAIKFQDQQKDRNIQSYFALKNSPILNKYFFKLEGDKINCFKENKKIGTIQNKSFDTLQEAVEILKKNEKALSSKEIYLLYNKISPFFDTVKNNTISLMNLASTQEVSEKINYSFDKERLRANIYIETKVAFEENNWLGKTIKINKVEFEVFDLIPRCTATNFPYQKTESDINLPQSMQKTLGHINLGVYLKPKNNGFIQVEDKISI